MNSKLFIEVKKEHFQVFIDNEDKFEDESVKALSKKSLEYYKKLERVKFINFYNWKLFFKLYKSLSNCINVFSSKSL